MTTTISDGWVKTCQGVIIPLLLSILVYQGSWMSQRQAIDPTPKPDPKPDPIPATSALSQSAKTYYQGFPGEFIDSAKKVKSGEISGPPDLKTYLAKYSTSFSAALTDTAKDHASTDGRTFTDKDGMAAELQAVGEALGAKK